MNILNPGRRAAEFRKSLRPRLPAGGAAAGRDLHDRHRQDGPNQALKVGDEDVRRNLFSGSFPAPVIDGFVSIESPQPLEVQGVYTTAAVDAGGATTGHSSIEIERYAGIDMSADLRTSKRAAFVRVPVFDDFWIAVVLFEIGVENRGPADAIDVTLRDEVTLQQQGAVASILALDDPIELPDVEIACVGVENEEIRFVLDFGLGDLADGATRRVRFLALVPVYELAGARAVVSLRNVATATLKGYEANPQDNRGEAFVELVP